MAEWLLLVVVVPAVVAPAVLLLGFAGCEFHHGIDPGTTYEVPVIQAADGKSVSVISLEWLISQSATGIEFQRSAVSQASPVPSQAFPVPPAPPSPHIYDDRGLNPWTTYEYRARAVYADEGRSAWSTPTNCTTFAFDFDAKATGNTGSGGTTATTTWPHTASAKATVVVVGVRWEHTNGVGTPKRTVTYGGTPMPPLGDPIGLNAPLNATNGIYLEFFGLVGPPAGVQIVSVSVSRTGLFPSLDIEGCSVSYIGTSAEFTVPSPVTGGGAGTSLNQTVASAENEMVVQMFTTESGLITGYDRTVLGGSNNFVVGEVRGNPSVSFNANRAAAVDYAGLAVRLVPIV